jgi:hypothetical protein
MRDLSDIRPEIFNALKLTSLIPAWWMGEAFEDGPEPFDVRVREATGD